MSEYLIFARKSYQEPLELLGSVHIEGAAEWEQTRLGERVREQFGEEDWIEMIALPQSAFTRVIPVSNA